MREIFRPVVSVFTGLAFLLMSVTGCALFEPSDGSGSIIRFSAGSSPETKVFYGRDTLGKIPMIWQTGDQIRIVSDRARTSDGSPSHDYRLIHTREDGAKSYAKFDTDAGNSQGREGLRWEESGSYEFYAVYPSSVPLLADGTFEADPSRDKFLMTAHTTASYQENQNVFLSFSPAFTAIEVTITADDNSVSIDNCGLTSLVTPLGGKFTARIGTDGKIVSNSISLTSSERSVSPVFSSGSASSKTFTFFCLPQELRYITLDCTFTKDGRQRNKTLDLTDANGTIRFAAFKYHRLAVTLDSSGGGEEINLTLGGAQMLLHILSNNLETKLVPYLKQKYNVSGPDWAIPDTSDYKKMLYSIWTKIRQDRYSSTVSSAHFSEADKIFSGELGDASFTAEELTIVQDVLNSVTWSGEVGNAGPKITDDIAASDFDWIPNLRELNYIENDQQNPRPSITIIDRPQLTYIKMNQYTNVYIDNCGGSDGLSLEISNANAAGEFTLKNVKLTKVNDWYELGNQHLNGAFTFENVSGIKVFNSGNASSVSVTNCPDLEEFNVNTAHALTTYSIDNCPNFKSFTIGNAGSDFASISLSNTPLFESGSAGSITRTAGFTVTLVNCSTEHAGASISLSNVSKDVAVTVSKTRSDNVTVSY